VVPVYAGRSELPEAVTRYLLTHYTSVCERYLAATAESDYSECGAFHTAQLNERWAARWALANPDSPLNRYRDGTSVRVQVQSLSFFRRASGLADLAQVRYLKAERASAEAAEKVSHWIASVQYAYVAPSTDPRLRSLNPLGFRIVEFHAEPELPEPERPASPPVASAELHTASVGSTP
jgi:type IV secretion system protein VirB8